MTKDTKTGNELASLKEDKLVGDDGNLETSEEAANRRGDQAIEDAWAAAYDNEEVVWDS